ncbi:hypothetical protein NLG97_g2670 [Lecanicillium saksenae]|uniref:Uncharacterized protein n=1 Tax=Lecanicillium saksenae TaxID=468837 RepID=A0ACC1R0X5_9HYPO|nr:hypothetical protein NLG97_g2670 [Lecanicillium saksenae]
MSRMLIYNQQQSAAPWLEKSKTCSEASSSSSSSSSRDSRQQQQQQEDGKQDNDRQKVKAKDGGGSGTQIEKKHPLVQYVNSLHGGSTGTA